MHGRLAVSINHFHMPGCHFLYWLEMHRDVVELQEELVGFPAPRMARGVMASSSALRASVQFRPGLAAYYSRHELMLLEDWAV